MKIFKLPQDVFHIQKCLLPDSDFIKSNYGSYCILVIPGSLFGILAKIGLNEKKQTAAGIFIDQSVIKFKDLYRTKRSVKFKDLAYQNFKLLSFPLDAITVNVRVVFGDVSSLMNQKKHNSRLQWIIKEILKFYTFARNSVIFLDILPERLRNGIFCLDILEVNEKVEDDIIYRCTDYTKVNIIECFEKKKYEMCYCHKEEVKLGGLNQVYKLLKEMVDFSKNISNLSPNVKLVNKVLLSGPAGCGKTSLIHLVVRECKTVLIELIIPEILSSLPGETEEKLQNLFDEAKLCADNQENCVILIEDIDIFGRKNGNNPSCDLKNCVNKLISLFEDFENVSGVVIIGTATNLEDVDPQLRRAKCLDDEIVITPPTEEDRGEIIHNIFEHFKVKVSENIIKNFALWTPGFVGADLYLAVQECLVLYNKKLGNSTEIDNYVFESCFKKVLSNMTPTSLKESVGILATKNIDFSKIGGLHNIKKLLDFSVKQQLLKPEKFLRFGIPLTKGILLYGPPGCAKTTLVKALAKESNMTFLCVSSADLYSPYVGDPEKKILQLFSQARIGAPAIIFIDEIDGLVGSKSGVRMRGVQERVLSTLLVEMDGVSVGTATRKDLSTDPSCDSRKHKKCTAKNEGNDIVVIGATNRPERLDEALKRPGRFDKLVYIPPPDEKERLYILQTLTEKMLLDETVDLQILARATEYYSGADLKNLCYESAILALAGNGMAVTPVNSIHFQDVLSRTRPSLNLEMITFYESFQRNLH